MRILEKIITSVLSTLIFSLSLAFLEYTPVAEQQAGIGYNSLEGLFILYFFYSFPIYLLGGGFYSYLVDVYFDVIQFCNEFLKYIIGYLVYIAGGLLVVGVLSVIILLTDGGTGGLLTFGALMFGALAALLFYHISLISKKALKLFAR
ncbi:hypothetical protein MKX79_13460 [Viridibacillus sp. FSL R5-0468]|uniref:hypothetical protein n=1 Tax=Viridibacillus sp. FSL R5-0468 TaxID=2921640 RepID=UPI0030FC3338